MDWIDLTFMVIELNGTALVALNSVFKLDWKLLDRIELDCIGLTWIALKRIELKIVIILDFEMNWAEPNHIWSEMD